MTTSPGKKKREMPKGGRKGGASFPRVALADALVYAKKLVTKTHAGAQPQDVIFSGVVGAKTGTGQVRIGALKQYGLIAGDAKVHYLATDLAKKINSAPDDELVSLYKVAALNPAIFRKIFDAFLGDTVSKAKLKQRAADVNVHPDETSSCVALYVSTLQLAELVSVDGENVTHISSLTDLSKELEVGQEEESLADDSSDGAVEEPDALLPSIQKDIVEKSRGSSKAPRAVFNVNITLDSSLDIEKLQKQLDILKKFGAI